MKNGDFVMEINVVFIAALLILILYIVAGGIKGFLRSSLSLIALILSGVIVMAVNPFVTGFLKDHTGLDEWISSRIESAVTGGLEAGTDAESDSETDGTAVVLEEDLTLPVDVTLPDGTYLPAGTVLPAGTALPAGLDIGQVRNEIDSQLSAAQQSKIIENLPVPESLRNSLEENNNPAVYQELGVQGFTGYLQSFIANICLSIIAYVITFIIVFFALRILTIVFNLVDKLPVIHGINHIAGALLGIVKGLLVLEILFLILIPFSGTAFGQTVLEQIGNNGFLSLLYHKNILIQLLMNVVAGSL